LSRVKRKTLFPLASEIQYSAIPETVYKFTSDESKSPVDSYQSIDYGYKGVYDHFAPPAQPEPIENYLPPKSPPSSLPYRYKQDYKSTYSSSPSSSPYDERVDAYMNSSVELERFDFTNFDAYRRPCKTTRYDSGGYATNYPKPSKCYN